MKSTGTFYSCPAQSSRPTSKHIAVEPWPTSALDFAKDATGFVAIPNALGLHSAVIRAILRLPQPDIAACVSGRTGPNAVPFSDMDVRALKSLYGFNNATPRTPGSPQFPLADGTTATFGVEAFALRMQAFIAYDRALIERFILFAQAHDSLKKNAGASRSSRWTVLLRWRRTSARSGRSKEQLALLHGLYGPSSRSLFELLMSELGIALPARCRTGRDTPPGQRSKCDAVLASVQRDWLCWKRSNSCKRSFYDISCMFGKL